MKIFLKSTKTGLLVAASGDWTARAREALDFVSPAAARDYRQSHRCFLTSVVFRFKNPRHDIELRNP